jgi:hypothetical protein
MDPLVNYYVNQARGRTEQSGHGLPAFAGVRYQRGHGLGSIFGNIFSKIRGALPWFFKTVGKHALKTGVNVATDVLEGRKVVESLKDRGLEGLKTAAEDVAPRVLEGIKSTARELIPQSGSGKRRKKRLINRKRKRQRRDIFG